MNGKKSKRLRREAESMTIGMPSIAVVQGRNPAFKEIRHPISLMSLGIKKIQIGIPQTLSIGCTRFVYKKLKVNTK